METIGSAIDKLVVADIRLWMLEDKRRDRSLDDSERLKACDTVSPVNAQRNALMDEIDEMVDQAVKRGEAPRMPKYKLYGN